MIKINKTPNADSRVNPNQPMDATIDELAKSTAEHAGHVRAGMEYFAELLEKAGNLHDITKFTTMEFFHKTLTTCMPGDEVKASEWYKMHITEERHHLNSKVPDDVNLIDIFEHIVDCVMAGLARSGTIYDISLPDEVLQKAHKNTIELLKKNVKVDSDDEDGEESKD